MTHLLGKDFNKNSIILHSLSKVFGLGKSLSKIMLNDLNIGNYCRFKDLNQNTFLKIVKWIEHNKILLDDVLKHKKLSDIDKLKSIKVYRGLRHIYRLPVRGQRTKTNAKSNKK
uniref:ribosomal protein S13 n=1 Tax=Cryptomonas gyropyrenoidosa TaxID=233257 RepID=UPI00279B9D2A|nr:ribosomal protein S13 [Cryptomonas gyropyrenoidosa]WFQ82698.1 ribosomal protein S13 [Cryptomonas gyropyrenoidosa]